MVEIKSRWKRVKDREKWAARGASFVTKAKATKVVWFPPKPVETGTTAASTAKKATTRGAKKTAGGAKKTTGAAKKTTKKATGAARRTTNGTKDVTGPASRKKT